MEGNSGVVDQIGDLTGNTCTIFRGDTGVATMWCRTARELLIPGYQKKLLKCSWLRDRHIQERLKWPGCGARRL